MPYICGICRSEHVSANALRVHRCRVHRSQQLEKPPVKAQRSYEPEVIFPSTVEVIGPKEARHPEQDITARPESGSSIVPVRYVSTRYYFDEESKPEETMDELDRLYSEEIKDKIRELKRMQLKVMIAEEERSIRESEARLNRKSDQRRDEDNEQGKSMLSALAWYYFFKNLNADLSIFR